MLFRSVDPQHEMIVAQDARRPGGRLVGAEFPPKPDLTDWCTLLRMAGVVPNPLCVEAIVRDKRRASEESSQEKTTDGQGSHQSLRRARKLFRRVQSGD